MSLTSEIPNCKHCKGFDVAFVKSWITQSPTTGIAFETTIWRCNECRKTFRTHEKVI